MSPTVLERRPSLESDPVEHLQRLARAHLATHAASTREQLVAMIEGLSDDDVEMVLAFAQRLVGPHPVA